MHDLKVKAVAAAGNLNAMSEVVGEVRSSTAATAQQTDAADAAHRSILSSIKSESAMKLQVAHQRYAKLIEIL